MPEKSTTAEAGTGGGRERRETRPSQGPPAITPPRTLPKGNLELVIPWSMMEEHCHHWTCSQQYQAAGHHYLGMTRLTSIEILASQVNPRLVVCQVAPAAADQSSTEQSSADNSHSHGNHEYKWTVNLDRTTETILSRVDTELELDWPLYRYILGLVKKYLQQEATETSVNYSAEKHIHQVRGTVESCRDGVQIVDSLKQDAQKEVSEVMESCSGEKHIEEATEKVKESASDDDMLPENTSFILKEKLTHMNNILHEKKKAQKEKRKLKYKRKAAQQREAAWMAFRNKEEKGKGIMVRNDIQQGSMFSKNPSKNTTTGAADIHHKDLRTNKKSVRGYQGPDNTIMNKVRASHHKGDKHYRSPVGPIARTRVVSNKELRPRASHPGLSTKAVITVGPEREVVTVSSNTNPRIDKTASQSPRSSAPVGSHTSVHRANTHTGHNVTPHNVINPRDTHQSHTS